MHGSIPKSPAANLKPFRCFFDGISTPEEEPPTTFKPLRCFFDGIDEVCEWYNDEDEKFHIQVEVTNRTWGRLFGYRGSFDVTWEQVGPDEIPNDVKPLREERRE